jgi:integrase
MAKVFKRRSRGELLPHFWCEYYENGKRHRVSTKCTDRGAAKLVADRFEREAADPRHHAANKATIGSAVQRLLIERKVRGRAAGTISMYVVKGSHLERVLGKEMRLAELTADRVDRFIAVRLAEGASRNTIGKELTTLRAALKLAKRAGELVADVEQLMPVAWSTGYEPRTAILRRASDLQPLLDLLLPDRAAHVAFVLATGARWSESLRATASDVDLERGLVRVRGTKTAGSAADVPILPWARPLLEMALAVRPKAGKLFRAWPNVGRELPAACKALGLEPLTPNDLRRTTATWLRAAGVEPSLVAAVLRHADSRMVERVYGRIRGETVGALIRDRLGIPCPAGAPDVTENGGHSGRSGHENPREFVPRDGIEPPTRGFSIRPSMRPYDGKSSPKRAPSEVASRRCAEVA